jgi:hypothetical protein
MTTSIDKNLTFSSGRSYDLRDDPATDILSSLVCYSSEDRVQLASKERCKIVEDSISAFPLLKPKFKFLGVTGETIADIISWRLL